MTQSSPRSTSSHPSAAETSPDWSTSARRRAPFYLAVAILLAILAALATFAYLDQIRQQSVPTGQALVARQAVRPGDMLTSDMVEARSVPVGILPDGTLTEMSQIVGRMAVVPIAAGEILLPGKLSSEGGGGLSGRLPNDRWAMVLPAGWLLSPVPEIAPGDRLDLLGYQKGGTQASAGLVVSAVEVLAVRGEKTNPDHLTLAVTMDEAVAIVYARANGLNLLPLLRPGGG